MIKVQVFVSEATFLVKSESNEEDKDRRDQEEEIQNLKKLPISCLKSRIGAEIKA